MTRFRPEEPRPMSRRAAILSSPSQVAIIPAGLSAGVAEARGLEVPASSDVGDPTGILEHIDGSLKRISRAVHDDIARIQDADPASADILTEWLRSVDKDHWMVRAHRA